MSGSGDSQREGDETGRASTRTVGRRTVLGWIGAGVGVAVVAGAVGVGVRGAANGAFSVGSGDPYRLWHDWAQREGMDRIVGAGVLACNPHNTQAWLMRRTDGGIELRSDPDRTMPRNDASGREHYAGLGCAAEQMAIAAAALGREARVEVRPEGETGADVRVSVGDDGSAGVRDAELADAIPTRHTDRGPYEGSVERSELEHLVPEPIQGTAVTWILDSDARARLGELYVEATQAIADDAEQSREAFSWFRNDRADIDAHRDGLTLDCQGLDATTLFLAKVLPAQSREEGDRFWVMSTRDIHTATAAAYGVIRVDDVADRVAQINGGRMLARLHLAATAAGLGLHHMNQITERIDRDAATGAPDVFSARWAALIGGAATTGLLSFRIGRSTRTPGLSPRRPLTAVVS